MKINHSKQKRCVYNEAVRFITAKFLNANLLLPLVCVNDVDDLMEVCQNALDI